MTAVTLRNCRGEGSVTISGGRGRPPAAVVADGAQGLLPKGLPGAPGYAEVQLQGWVNQAHTRSNGSESGKLELANSKGEPQVWLHAQARRSKQRHVLVENGATARWLGKRTDDLLEVQISGFVNVDHVMPSIGAADAGLSLLHAALSPYALTEAKCSILQWNLWGDPQPGDMTDEAAVRDKNDRQLEAIAGAIRQHEPTVLNFCEYLHHHSRTDYPYLKKHFDDLTAAIKKMGYDVVHEAVKRTPFMAVKSGVRVIDAGHGVEGVCRANWVRIEVAGHRTMIVGVHLASGAGKSDVKRGELAAALKLARPASKGDSAVVSGDCNWFSESKSPPDGCGPWMTVGHGGWDSLFEEVRPSGAEGTMVNQKGLQRGFIDKTLFTKETLQVACAMQIGDKPVCEPGKSYPDYRFRHPSDHISTFVEFSFA